MRRVQAKYRELERDILKATRDVLRANGKEVNMVEYGYCHCGCGGKTAISDYNNKQDGHKKGEPKKYIQFHHMQDKSRLGQRWKGGRFKLKNGWMIYSPEHPRQSNGKYVFEHILVAEKALGKYLPPGAVIHHINQNPFDNKSSNLVVCESQGYHNILHRRKRSFEATGNPNLIKCNYCKQYDIPEKIYRNGLYKNGRGYWHPGCSALYKRLKRKESNENKGI